MEPQFYQGAWGCMMGCSRTGAVHLRDKQKSQDAWASWFGAQKNEPAFALAAADGHGCPRHKHSDVGAALAVKTAVEECRRLVQVGKKSGKGQPHLGAKPAADHAINFNKNFPGVVVESWRRRVWEQARQNRLLTDKDGPERRMEMLKSHGTTVLAAMLHGEMLYLAQLGDGAVLVLNRQGVFETPTRVASDLLGQETYSLCLPDAAQHWGVCVVPVAQVELLLLATDGLSDAFEPPSEFLNWTLDFHRIARQYPPQDMAKALPKWLDDISSHSIGDDLTLAACLFNQREEGRGG